MRGWNLRHLDLLELRGGHLLCGRGDDLLELHRGDVLCRSIKQLHELWRGNLPSILKCDRLRQLCRGLLLVAFFLCHLRCG